MKTFQHMHVDLTGFDNANTRASCQACVSLVSTASGQCESVVQLTLAHTMREHLSRMTCTSSEVRLLWKDRTGLAAN